MERSMAFGVSCCRRNAWTWQTPSSPAASGLVEKATRSVSFEVFHKTWIPKLRDLPHKSATSKSVGKVVQLSSRKVTGAPASISSIDHFFNKPIGKGPSSSHGFHHEP